MASRRRKKRGSEQAGYYDESQFSELSRYASSNYSRNDSHSGSRNSSSNATNARSKSTQSSSAHSLSRTSYASYDSDARFNSHDHASAAAYSKIRKRRKRKKVILGVLIAVLAIVLAGGGAAFAYLVNLNNNLTDGLDQSLKDQLATVDEPTDPFYMLLMGIDGSIERDNSGEYGGSYRSDSIILVRIDPQKKTAALISIPRDTMIEDMGDYGTQKINSALTLGGPSLAVESVSELAGVSIAHYAEVNFDGLVAVVDALGGIEVDVPMEINDPEAGGYVAAGQQTLNGNQALIVCRSRHTYDDYGAGDYYRSACQRLVLSAIANKLLTSDWATIANTLTLASEYIGTDMTVDEILGIALSMQGMDTSTSLWTASCPTTSEYIDDLWYEVPDEDAWETMMSRVDSGLPPTTSTDVDADTGIIWSNAGSSTSSATGTDAINPEIEIAVRNGNGVSGASETAAELLEGAGYSNMDTANADSFDYTNTMVVYRDETMADDARVIANVLGCGVVYYDEQQEYLFSTDILVVLGADFSG